MASSSVPEESDCDSDPPPAPQKRSSTHHIISEAEEEEDSAPPKKPAPKKKAPQVVFSQLGHVSHTIVPSLKQQQLSKFLLLFNWLLYPPHIVSAQDTSNAMILSLQKQLKKFQASNRKNAQQQSEIEHELSQANTALT